MPAATIRPRHSALVRVTHWITALAFLALSGLAVLLTRDTAAFGVILLIHLAAVILSFASAPYSKFVHVVFRFAALVRDNAEQLPADPRP